MPRTNRGANATLLVTLLLTLTGCGAETLTKDISRAEYEAANKLWPFTVDSGTLKCTEPAVITFAVGDDDYALNAPARMESWTLDVEPIISDDVGPDVTIVDVLDDATDLCDELNA